MAFGSRVTETFKPHSDLDLCIVGSEPVSLMQWATLRELLSESDLPIRVDLVEWSSLTPQFQHIIQQQAVRFC